MFDGFSSGGFLNSKDGYPEGGGFGFGEGGGQGGSFTPFPAHGVEPSVTACPPVTVRMLMRSQAENPDISRLVYYGDEVPFFSLVGICYNFRIVDEAGSRHWQFVLNDGTGGVTVERLTVIRAIANSTWLTAQQTLLESQLSGSPQYVKIFGELNFQHSAAPDEPPFRVRASQLFLLTARAGGGGSGAAGGEDGKGEKMDILQALPAPGKSYEIFLHQLQVAQHCIQRRGLQENVGETLAQALGAVKGGAYDPYNPYDPPPRASIHADAGEGTPGGPGSGPLKNVGSARSSVEPTQKMASTARPAPVPSPTSARSVAPGSDGELLRKTILEKLVSMIETHPQGLHIRALSHFCKAERTSVLAALRALEAEGLVFPTDGLTANMWMAFPENDF